MLQQRSSAFLPLKLMATLSHCQACLLVFPCKPSTSSFLTYTPFVHWPRDMFATMVCAVCMLVVYTCPLDSTRLPPPQESMGFVTCATWLPGRTSRCVQAAQVTSKNGIGKGCCPFPDQHLRIDGPAFPDLLGPMPPAPFCWSAVFPDRFR